MPNFLDEVVKYSKKERCFNFIINRILTDTNK